MWIYYPYSRAYRFYELTFSNGGVLQKFERKSEFVITQDGYKEEEIRHLTLTLEGYVPPVTKASLFIPWFLLIGVSTMFIIKRKRR